MAKEKDKDKDAGSAPAKSKKWVFLLAVPLIVLLLAGGAVGAYFLASLSDGGRADASAGDEGPKARELGPLVEVGALVVNIAHRDSSRFLKMGITLEARDDRAAREIENRMPQLKDAALLLAGNKTFDDIRDLQGKMQLKADLLARFNELAGRDRVVDLYFTDFVVQ